MDMKYDIEKMKGDFLKKHSLEQIMQANEEAQTEQARKAQERKEQERADVEEMRKALQFAKEMVKPGSVTEEDRKRFASFDCFEATMPTGGQLQDLQVSGRRILAEQESNEKESAENTAKTAEKLLFLSDFHRLRWISASELMIAHSKHGLTEIYEKSKERTLTGLLGYVPETVEKLRARKDALPESGNRKERTKFLVITLVAILVAVLVQFLPAISGLFTEENVSSCLMAVGVIVTIVAFFIAGFGGAAVFLVVYALLITLVQLVVPLAVFGKILVLLLLAALAIYAFRHYCDHNRRLQPAYLQRREKEVAALRADFDKCKAYAAKISEQVEIVLRETEEQEKKAAERDEPWSTEEKEFRATVGEYLAQYRKKIDSMVQELAITIPIR